MPELEPSLAKLPGFRPYPRAWQTPIEGAATRPGWQQRSTRQQPRGLPLVLALVALLVAAPAHAWNYSEHREITCEAVANVCGWLDTKAQQATPAPGAPSPADSTAVEVLRSFLCVRSCGVARPVATVRPLFPGTPSGDESYDLGDVAALIDYKNDPLLLQDTRFSEIAEIRKELLNEAWEAFLADEHFHPYYIRGARNAYAVARARMVYASRQLTRGARAEGTEELRRALFSAARAAHLLEDSFASGHNATSLKNSEDPLATTMVHNRYNGRGLRYHRMGQYDDSWMGYGDGHLHDLANEENRRRVVQAVTTLLSDLVAGYLDLSASEVGYTDFGGDVQTLMPDVESDSIDRIGLFQILLGYTYTTRIFESPSERRTAFHTLGATAEFPLGASVSARLGLDVEWYARRAATLDMLTEGTDDDSRLRYLGPGLGVGIHSGTMFRTLRAGATFDARLGYVNAAMDVPAPSSWFDGYNLGAYAELLLYYGALRVGVNQGLRRSSLQENEFDFNVGTSAAFAWRSLAF